MTGPLGEKGQKVRLEKSIIATIDEKREGENVARGKKIPGEKNTTAIGLGGTKSKIPVYSVKGKRVTTSGKKGNICEPF